MVSHRENVQSKSPLARMMAIEGVYVTHDPKAETASFNLVDRVVTLPVLKNMTGFIYDWFIAHEISHALYTPPKEYEILAKETHPIIANVCEDARIEKLIKRKYPGTKKDCYKFYKHFVSDEQDFFGLKDKPDLNKLTLVDKLNLHFKIGPFKTIPFSQEEMYFVNALTDVETFEEVDKIARELFEWMKNNNQIIEVFITKSTLSTESSGDNKDGESSGNGDKEFKTNPNYVDMGHTQETFDKTFKKEIQANPTTDDVTFGNIYKITPELFNMVLKNPINISDDGNLKEINFHKKVTPIVNMMVSQFNMRKAAKEYQRSHISKSGSLDSKKLSLYKVKDDIFKRNTVVNEAKNHGMVMFIDWSGSMSSYMESTIKQLIILTEFCKKVHIPFVVYTFTSCPNKENIKYNQDVDSIFGIPKQLSMVELLNSKDKTNVMRKKADYILSSVQNGNYNHIDYMGGTPLNTTAFFAEAAIKRFQSNNNVEKTIFILLSDGEPTDSIQKNSIVVSSKKTIIRDSETYKNYTLSGSNMNTFHGIFEYVKDKCNVWANVGFYLTERLTPYDIGLISPTFNKTEYTKAISDFTKNSSYTFPKTNAFEKYFAVSVNNFSMGYENDDELLNIKSKSQLQKKFQAHLQQKSNSMMFLKKFIETIA